MKAALEQRIGERPGEGADHHRDAEGYARGFIGPELQQLQRIGGRADESEGFGARGAGAEVGLLQRLRIFCDETEMTGDIPAADDGQADHHGCEQALVVGAKIAILQHEGQQCQRKSGSDPRLHAALTDAKCPGKQPCQVLPLIELDGERAQHFRAQRCKQAA